MPFFTCSSWVLKKLIPRNNISGKTTNINFRVNIEFFNDEIFYEVTTNFVFDNICSFIY